MAAVNKKKQIAEIVKSGKDPGYFMKKYVSIQHPNRGMIKFQLYPFQEESLAEFKDNRFNVVLKSRQLGLSTLVAAYALWMAIFKKDKNILVIATKLSVAVNFIRKVKTMLRSLPGWLVLPQIVADNRQTIEFNNGSIIKAVPTSDDAGRSEALSLLIVDEAAFVKNFDTLWMGLYPTLSTGGEAIILSTPNGVGGQYHKLYTDAVLGENEFNPIKLPWDVHPERGEDWFSTETKNMSKRQIAQELLCDFVASGETFLQSENLEWIRDMVREPQDRWGDDNNIWVWQYPMSSHKYIISADVSRGDAKDFSTFHVIDVDTDEVVAEYKGKIPPDRFGELLEWTGKKYYNALICPENNTFGYTTVMKLKDIGYPNLYYESSRGFLIGNYTASQEKKVPGFSTQGKSRVQILSKLEEVIRNRSIRIYSSRLYDELKTFIWKGHKAQAQKSANDDLVMALAIGVWLYDAGGNYSKDSDTLNKSMLAGMSVTNRTYEQPKMSSSTPMKSINPFSAVKDEDYQKLRNNNPRLPNTNFDWLNK
tara:strand:- start:8670 stop:10277 length:1608 start_codon:yes stop_codon:yes gene_type:complete